MARTLDPSVVIVARSPDAVTYRHTDGRTWTVRGACTQCGLCVVGAANADGYVWHGPVGFPGAVTDVRVAQGRLDEPVTPSFPDAMRRMRERIAPDAPGCSLTVTM